MSKPPGNTKASGKGTPRAAAIALAVLLGTLTPGILHSAEPNTLSLPDRNSPEMAWWRNSMATREQRLEWWREARFGMFVHWGVYSYLGGTWNGHAVKGYGEHIQRILKIPIPVYREQVAGKFNPVDFDADAWIKAAKEAGMGYFIITAKHHDGFAMYDSKVSDYNVVKATPFHRDPMKELRAACQKYGLKFGFYYSHAFDWGDANGPGNDWDYDNPGGDRGLHGGRDWWVASPELLPKVRKYVDEKSIPQLLELIRNYDPDILWFDTPHKLPDSENLRILKAVREAKPSIVINGRLVRNGGDYASTADRPAEFAPHDGDWEGIPTTNESYGYNQNDHSHKPPEHFIRLLAKAAARGGNVLLNIGPMGNGRMDPADLSILHGIGEWWKVNGASIRGTSRTPLPVQAWGESTLEGNNLYLHVFQWPSDGKLVVGGLKSKVKQAYLLADCREGGSAPTGKRLLKVMRLNPLDILVDVPAAAPDKTDSVVVLEGSESPATDSARLLLPEIKQDTLRVFDGNLRGKSLRFGAGKTRDAYVENWSNPADSISWTVRLTEAATFRINLVTDAERGSAGSTFVLKAGEQSLAGIVQPGESVSLSLGTLHLKPGTFEIQLLPTKIQGTELMRPRSLLLSSAN